MKKILAAALLSGLAALPAQATVTVIGSVAGYVPQAGVVVAEFEGPSPIYSGPTYVGTTPGTRAAPLGDATGYGAVGPAPNITPATLDLSSFGTINTLSLYWGSIDQYNTITFYGTSGDIASFDGGDSLIQPATGSQTDTSANRTVTFSFTGGDQNAVKGVRFSSTEQAFEYDHVSIAAVPEPASWAMMLSGLGMIGFSMRRRSRRTAALA